jgi:hypothetical protein
MGDWVRTSPIWLLGFLLFIATLACALAGSSVNRWYTKRFGGKDRLSETQVGYVVSIVYALLGLLLGFTFQIAIERFDLRRQLVLRDANAIEILYLKVQLLDEPHRSRLSGRAGQARRSKRRQTAGARRSLAAGAVDDGHSRLRKREESRFFHLVRRISRRCREHRFRSKGGATSANSDDDHCRPDLLFARRGDGAWGRHEISQK